MTQVLSLECPRNYQLPPSIYKYLVPAPRRHWPGQAAAAPPPITGRSRGEVLCFVVTRSGHGGQGDIAHTDTLCGDMDNLDMETSGCCVHVSDAVWRLQLVNSAGVRKSSSGATWEVSSPASLTSPDPGDPLTGICKYRVNIYTYITHRLCSGIGN